MPKSTTYLPDVNVWVALASARHIHSPAASTWIKGVSDARILFSRITQMGMLRLLTNSKVMGDDVMEKSQAWATYDSMLKDPRLSFQTEPMGIETIWRDQARQTSPHLDWTDSYLVAFAKAAGCTLVTFDQTLSTIKDIAVLLLQ